MTAIPSYFTDFLAEIRLTDALERKCQEKHQQLRELLKADVELSTIIIDAFLQGSYRRSTGVRPLDPNGRKEHVDVDLVIVTTLDPDTNSPDRVVARFTPFLNRHFPSRWKRNDRSMKVTYDDTPVTLDLVVTAAPSMIVQEAIKAAERRRRGREMPLTLSERSLGDVGDILSMREAVSAIRKSASSQDWRDDALLIPDRALQNWVKTHPIEQISWTDAKNRRTSGHFVNVVKTTKWWRVRNASPEHPKGYPLEHFMGAVCPDGVDSVSEGFTRALEAIVRDYASDVRMGRKPRLQDHGVPEHDVFQRITADDFAAFYGLIQGAAGLARTALDAPTTVASAFAWRQLLGPEFPEPPKEGGFTERTAASTIASTGRYG